MPATRITASTSSEYESGHGIPWAFVVALVSLLGLGGCGKKGPPLPPLSRTPPPVHDLEATLAGNMLELSWSAEAPPEPGEARIVYQVAWESGTGSPGAAAREAESIPPASSAQLQGEMLRASGPEAKQFLIRARRQEGGFAGWEAGASRHRKRLSSSVDLGRAPAGGWVRAAVIARHRRSEQMSNLVLVRVPEQALPRAPELMPVPEQEGIRLRWPALRSSMRLELFRGEGSSGALMPLAQIDPGTGEFLDASVRQGETYRYAARLRARAGEGAWSTGPAFETGTVRFLDTFPPQPPRGLRLVVEAEGARLLWSPSRESDLAGYRIYRRMGEQAEMVMVVEPWEVTWLDAGVEEGAPLEYWLTAFDSSPQANESAPSQRVATVMRRLRALPGSQPGPAPGQDP